MYLRKGVTSWHQDNQKKSYCFIELQHHIDAFNTTKDTIKTENKLTFLDFTKPFHLYTEVSNIQLGDKLVRDGKSLGFYTRKLSSTQHNYTVGEKELLGIP